MSRDKGSQSLHISGGQISNVQLGGIAGGDQSVSQSQQAGPASVEQALTPDDVAMLIDQLKILFEDSALPTIEKSKAVRSIDAAKDEVQANEPDKEFAAKSLQRATKVLQDAGETVEAGTGLWQKIKPIAETVSPWLGVATSFLI